MGDGSLSQEEIDALLMGAEDVGGSDPFGAAPKGMDFGGMSGASGLSPSQRDILGESFGEAMQTAGTGFSGLLSRNVIITNAVAEEISASALSGDIPGGSVIASMSMGNAATALAFPGDISRKIAMLMMSHDMEPAELTEADLSTIGEVANTIVSALAQNLRSRFNDDLKPSAPDVMVHSGPMTAPNIPSDKILRISYNINIEGLGSGRLLHYIDANAAQRWVNSAGGGAPRAAAPRAAAAAPAAGMGMGVAINPVSFPSLQTSGMAQMPANFELLLDVQMVLTVELGRTRKYVKDILGLGEGSIIELDKLAGEPVDLLVNGKLIAKGEVVVIDENFGVRVTDIVGPAERLARMTGKS